ncbi:MAG: DUF58 domain-containing protein [Candidatus Sumerlaeia bacterium]|nr:DUF58 domain-containing protein [Candidatus Sumerlaeia bacterium]
MKSMATENSPALSSVVRRGNRLKTRLKEQFRRSIGKRFALRLTVEGWSMVAAMLLIGLAALNTAAPLLYLMFSIICAFFVFSAILATNTVRGIEVRRQLPQVWMAAKPVPIHLKIRNKKLFSSSFSLRLHDHLQGGEVVGSTFADRIPPRGREQTFLYESLFMRRGVYEFQSIEVATRFPFGLIDRQLYFSTPDRLLLLPQIIPVDQIMLEARSELGDFDSHQKGIGSGLYGFREYTAEQSAKDIHWKVSARRGQLMVREYESEERRRACVTLDNRVPEGPVPDSIKEDFEKAIVLTASVIDWLVRRDHEVELRTASGIVGFGGGFPHVTRCLRALALLELVPYDKTSRFNGLNVDPTIVTIPVVIKGRLNRSRGFFPVSVSEFARELEGIFDPPVEGGEGARL